MNGWKDLFGNLEHRFGDVPEDVQRGDWLTALVEPPSLWKTLSRRGSVRAFHKTKPALDELKTLAALALAAPTKSDLQQRDIILINDEQQLQRMKSLLAGQAWISGSPVLVVFCANNRRQRLLHELRSHAFANDHLDAFFNASVDAAIVLATFVLAAEAAGLGTCPISAIRNEADQASDILGLPDHVFPVAGLAVGLPIEAPEPSLRLPLSSTVHENHYSSADPRPEIEAYDRRRTDAQPYTTQRRVEIFESTEPYTWSEDKARQYSLPERADFGAFIRSKGFSMD